MMVDKEIKIGNLIRFESQFSIILPTYNDIKYEHLCKNPVSVRVLCTKQHETNETAVVVDSRNVNFLYSIDFHSKKSLTAKAMAYKVLMTKNNDMFWFVMNELPASFKTKLVVEDI